MDTNKKTKIEYDARGARICTRCGRSEKARESFRTLLDDDFRAVGCVCNHCAPRSELDDYDESGESDYDDER